MDIEINNMLKDCAKFILKKLSSISEILEVTRFTNKNNESRIQAYNLLLTKSCRNRVCY